MKHLHDKKQQNHEYEGEPSDVASVDPEPLHEEGASEEKINFESSPTLETGRNENELPPPNTVSGKLLHKFGFNTGAELKQELRWFLWMHFIISVPIIVTQICNQLISSTDISFVGHLGNDYLASSSLATAATNLLTYLPVGLLTGMETLINQAVGAKNYKIIPTITHRAFILISLFCIPLSVLFYFLEYPFQWIGASTNPEVIEQAALFSKFLIPSLWFTAYQRLLSQYLVTQHITWPVLFVSIVGVFQNILMNYLCIYPFGWGYIGAAVATSFTRGFQFLFILTVALIIDIRRRIVNNRKQKLQANPRIGSSEVVEESPTGKTFEDSSTPVTPSAPAKAEDQEQQRYLILYNKIEFKELIHWRGYWQYLKFGIPGGAAFIFDVWGFGLTSITSSFLGAKNIAAHQIIFNLIAIAYMVPLGVSVGGAVIVGNRMGENQPKKAKFSSHLTMLFCTLVMFLAALILFVIKDYVGYLYTTDEQVLPIVGFTMLAAVSFGVFDGCQTACNASLKAIGKPVYGAILNFVAYYILGLPLGVLFAYYFNWAANGIWLGLLVGLFFVSICLVVILEWGINWQKAAANICKEVGGATSPDTEAKLTEQQETELKMQDEVQLLREDETNV